MHKPKTKLKPQCKIVGSYQRAFYVGEFGNQKLSFLELKSPMDSTIEFWELFFLDLSCILIWDLCPQQVIVLQWIAGKRWDDI